MKSSYPHGIKRRYRTKKSNSGKSSQNSDEGSSANHQKPQSSKHPSSQHSETNPSSIKTKTSNNLRDDDSNSNQLEFTENSAYSGGVEDLDQNAKINDKFQELSDQYLSSDQSHDFLISKTEDLSEIDNWNRDLFNFGNSLDQFHFSPSNQLIEKIKELVIASNENKNEGNISSNPQGLLYPNENTTTLFFSALLNELKFYQNHSIPCPFHPIHLLNQV